VGEGTTFRLIIPAPVVAHDSDSQIPSVPPRTRALRVLIVDDDPILLKSLQTVLESDGHSVVASAGGQAGIDTFLAAVAREESFSLVITDLGMPQVDGRKVLAAVKKASPSTPVILLTGWGQRLVDSETIPAGASRILSKPPRLHELREALLACVGSSSSSISGEAGDIA
jgi:CheY-like chemotaxis protein